MDKIRIALVDDISDIREYMCSIFSREADMEIVGTASSGKEGIKVVLETKPDIVLMDIQMETDTAGIDAIRTIKEKLEAVKIIVLTIHDEDELLFQAFCAGAVDFVTKTSSIVEVLNSVRSVYSNKMSLRPDISQKIVEEMARLKSAETSLLYGMNIISRLTTSEFEILRALYDGYSYKQIARQRSVEDVTIRTQVNKMTKKFEGTSLKGVVDTLKKIQFFEYYKF